MDLGCFRLFLVFEDFCPKLKIVECLVNFNYKIYTFLKRKKILEKRTVKQYNILNTSGILRSASNIKNQIKCSTK